MPNAAGAILPGFTFNTGITRPRHPLMNAGTIALIEPGDPLQALAGVPAALPNIASPVVEAKAAGAGAAWSYLDEITPGKWKRERTKLGGLHAASAAVAGSARAQYYAPTAFNDYLKTIRSHNIVSYLVARPTAIPPSTMSGTHQVFGWFNFPSPPASGTGGWGIRADFSATPNPANTTLMSLWYDPGSGGGVSAFGNTTGGSGWAGGTLRVPTGNTFMMVINYKDVQTSDLKMMLGWATGSSGWGMVHYLAGMEDLTVSGRAWTDVLNAVEAWRQSELLTAGGRYYGDTWTAPATLSA